MSCLPRYLGEGEVTVDKAVGGQETSYNQQISCFYTILFTQGLQRHRDFGWLVVSSPGESSALLLCSSVCVTSGMD